MGVEDLKTRSDKLKGEVNASKNQFDVIQKVDPDVMDFQFGKKITEFLKGCDS